MNCVSFFMSYPLYSLPKATTYLIICFDICERKTHIAGRDPCLVLSRLCIIRWRDNPNIIEIKEIDYT
jgi:hypothetical protein